MTYYVYMDLLKDRGLPDFECKSLEDIRTQIIDHYLDKDVSLPERIKHVRLEIEDQIHADINERSLGILNREIEHEYHEEWKNREYDEQHERAVSSPSFQNGGM